MIKDIMAKLRKVQNQQTPSNKTLKKIIFVTNVEYM